ncbi:MAG: metal ABC transporter substrate-binding protein [Clostridiales Family XIII bacterium]|nr:metal ABC transporter substrate-binding protein [Clostridiales Family XIII bacterium]
MKKHAFIFAIVLFVCILLLGCNAEDKNSDNENDEKLNIVATIFPEYDFARAIVGDKATVSMLTDPGASIHSFDPSPSDIKKVQSADVFIYVGGESEEWVDSILQSLDTDNMKIIRLMDSVNVVEEELKEGMTPEEEDVDAEETESEELEYDEHVWTSPQNAILLIDAITVAICEADEANASVYESNAAAYKEKLNDIDKQIKDLVKGAKRNKIVVADKFPFRYFVDQYGLDYVAAFPGCSDQTDAGAATIAYLINTVEQEEIPYIYYVELSNKSCATAISEQTGAGMLLLNSGENISKTDFNNGVTYVDLMNQNIETLKKGLEE